MSSFLAAEQPFWSTFCRHWFGLVRSSVPTFLVLLPAYILVTVAASVVSVLVLLIFGKAAFHLVCMMSPLIFIVIGMAIGRIEPACRRAAKPEAWYPVASKFWRYGAPLAVTIGLTLNVVVLVSLVLSDLNSFHAGKLPNLTFPADLFTSEKLHLIPMLLTTSVEQQLMFMPLFVVLGGRLEPHLVGLILSGKLSLGEAKILQEGFSKREKFFLGPLRLLVLVGVGFQFWAKHLDATQNLMGTAMLLVSYLGWLFYACLLAHSSRSAGNLQAKKNPA
jgi:hypothetical protein